MDTTKKDNLQLHQLIDAIREKLLNHGAHVRYDAMCDVAQITRETAELEDSGLEAEYITGTWYWAIREEGTGIFPNTDDLKEWLNYWQSTACSVFVIKYNGRNKTYSFEVKEIFDRERYGLD